MKLVVQRVSEAKVEVDNEIVGFTNFGPSMDEEYDNCWKYSHYTY
mgnify:CR=1 FL=1